LQPSTRRSGALTALLLKLFKMGLLVQLLIVVLVVEVAAVEFELLCFAIVIESLYSSIVSSRFSINWSNMLD